MATNTVNTANSLLSGLNSAYTSTSTSANKTKGTGEVNKEDFLTMLVAQLKNQDPMDPMNNQDFAVNLAQFSQLEQLISINEKVTSGSTSSSGDSLASYLGQEVVLNSSDIQVTGGDGGKVGFTLPSAAAQVNVELLNADGTVKETVKLGSMAAGKQTVSLSDLSTQSGQYTVQISAISSTGMALSPDASVVGTVSGFVPGADPKLIVNGDEVSPGDIKEVRLPSE